MSDKYNDYLQTDYWKAVSDAVKKRAGYRCQVCNSQHDLHAHHRTYDHRFSEMCHLEDLTCLCRRCHGIFHGQLPSAVMAPQAPGMAAAKKPRVIPSSSGDGFIVRPIIAADINAMMPSGDPITLTKDLIRRVQIKGAFTSATIGALGVTSIEKGWPKRLIGTKISSAQYRKALEGRHIYASPRS